MNQTEPIITLTQYMPRAGACEQPHLTGREAARCAGVAVFDELQARGYPREAVIAGLARALADVTDESTRP